MADADPKMQKNAEPIIAEPVLADPVPEAEPAARRAWLRPLLMFGVPLLVLAVVGYFWLTSGRFVSTDNAYVRQDKVSVAAEVTGRIDRVAVKENQHVNAGDVLFEIDPGSFRIALSQTDAAIANAQVTVATLESSYQGTGADIEAARDGIAAAQEDYARQAELMKRGFTTRARLEQSQHGLEQARAKLASAEADAAEAKSKLSTGAAVPGQNPQIAAALAQRDQALWNLSRTRVLAPISGYVSQSQRLQPGQMMMTGLPAVTVVSDQPAWVEANFKETDLNKMRVGQCAAVKFDAYPGLKLKGHVQSIGVGTGSESSVLPAQNANGNWVKVTQRVPVRIAIDEKSPRELIAGLSTSVSVGVAGTCP
jgi:membrane fusion protein (multidrug efflux system)